ncbi:MAG: acyl carrier protein [Hyphomonadaceae bacterium]|nr:acyl carrier protein [Hyphomonadaceae bacterium]
MRTEIETFVAALLDLPAPPAPGLNYIDAGQLDSMALMNLVVALEDRFDIELSDDDIVSDEFRTFGGLVAIVQRTIAKGLVAA